MSFRHLRFRSRKGFTLTEIAIVLGIIGLILSSIWSSSAMVMKNQRITKSVRSFLAISQGVRSFYSNTSGFGVAGIQTDITCAAATYGIFPSDVVNSAPCVTNNGSTYPVNSWGGFYQLYASTSSPAASDTVFELQMEGNFDSSVCKAFLTELVNAHPDGLLYYFDDLWHPIPAGNVTPGTFACTTMNISTTWTLH